MRIIDASLDVENPEEPLIIDFHQDAVVSLSATVRSLLAPPTAHSLIHFIYRMTTSAQRAKADRSSFTRRERSMWMGS
jgi:hypothetical protein